MPNPRYIQLKKQGEIYIAEPSVELLRKIKTASNVFYSNLGWFCEQNGFLERELAEISGVYLIGSHATESKWDDDTSDVDFKLLNPIATPSDLHQYKRDVLDRLLCQGGSENKKRWIDLFFAQRDDQIMDPRFDLTSYWKSVSKR